MRVALRLTGIPRVMTIVLLGLAMRVSGSIEAATLIVTNTADSGPGSLRDTIAMAGNGSVIQFDAALSGQTIILTSDELAIDKDITISGPGRDLLTVAKTPSQPPYFRILNVMPGHTVTIAGLTISGGYTSGSFGAGVLNDKATLTISNCAVSGNFADSGAGGGGIYNTGTLSIVNSTVSSNQASFTFGNPFGYGGGINSSGTLTIIRSTISNNTAAIQGGGIICAGMITITDSTISGNRAGSDTLALTGLGGGIFYSSGSGMLVINNSTINGNTSRGSESGAGGGIFSSGVVAISNSTVSGNFAYDKGGACYNGGTLEIDRSTFSGNSATLSTDGIFSTSVSANAVLEIGNTILSNAGANIFNDGGTVASRGYNLSNDNGGGFLTGLGDQINANPMLGPLQDNGGPTFTHSPLSGSPALDAGDPTFTPPPLYDQRGPGYNRVFNGRIDIGALEVQPASSPTPTPTPTVTPSATPTPAPSPARALNISTRLRVETGNNVLIGGFIVAGNAPKNVAVRGIGPSLTAFGIGDALADPTLELRDASGALIFQNDNWQDNPAHAAQLTALGLAPPHPNESGIVATLNPGASYTAILSGKNGGTGVGVVEIYDTNQGADSQLANISTRGFVQAGDNVMIGGFILGGNSNTGIAVRGIGPSLAQFGLSPVLGDPTLELRDSNGALLIANDNWQDEPASAAQLNAHGLAPQNSLESGMFASLPPGAFTAILAGKDGGTGIALVEIYNVH